MPQDGLFFRIVRRLFLLFGTFASLAIFAICVWGGWETWNKEHRHIEQPVGGPETWVTKTTGYDVQLAPLETQAPTAAQTVSASSENALYVMFRETSVSVAPTVAPVTGQEEVTNIMLIDKQTGGGKWLFAGKRRNILGRYGVREGNRDADTAVDARPIVGLVLLVDETEGAMLAVDMDVSVYYWRLGKPDAVSLLKGVKYVSNGRVGSNYNVVYKKAGKTISAIYSIPDFKLISETTLPEP